MSRKKKANNRIIILFFKKERKVFVGNSAAEISKRCGLYKQTITNAALKAEKVSVYKETVTIKNREVEIFTDGIYETVNYICFVTNDFIKGAKRKGNFSY